MDNQEEYKTVKERIDEIHQNAEEANKKKILSKKNSEQKLGGLTAKDKDLAQRMLPILESTAFSAVQELLQNQLILLMNDPFSRPSPADFDSTNNNRAEWVAYKQGILKGLNISIKIPHALIHQYLKELEREDKKPS